MRLLRSWPAKVPARRAHVVDDVERLVMDNYDYRPLGDVDDDVLLLEWDVAVSREDLRRFAERACQTPDRTLVAPYRLYMSSGGHQAHLARPIWCHRLFTGPQSMRIVEPGDPVCHFFGMGMVYLPKALIVGFLDFLAGLSPERIFDDGTFSQWHWRNAPEPEVPITWDIRPVHLHYNLPELSHDNAAAMAAGPARRRSGPRDLDLGDRSGDRAVAAAGR